MRREPPPVEPVEPRIAAALTLAMPGLGHAGIGEWGRGVLAFSWVFASLGLLRFSLIGCALTGLALGALVAWDAWRGSRRRDAGHPPRRLRLRGWLLIPFLLLAGGSGVVWAAAEIAELLS